MNCSALNGLFPASFWSSKGPQRRRDSSVGLMTPAIVHGGEVEAVTQVRKLTFSAAFEAHPERFVRGTPRPPVVPEAAWMNKPKTNSSISEACALAENTLIPRVQGDGSMRDRRSCGILEVDFLDPTHDRPGTTLNSFRRCLKIMDTFRWSRRPTLDRA